MDGLSYYMSSELSSGKTKQALVSIAESHENSSYCSEECTCGDLQSCPVGQAQQQALQQAEQQARQYRRHLDRAMSLAQKLFYMYLEMSWIARPPSREVPFFELRGPQQIVLRTKDVNHEIVRPDHDAVFPYDLVNNRIHLALLTRESWNHEDCIIELVLSFLKDVIKWLSRVTHKISNDTMRVVEEPVELLNYTNRLKPDFSSAGPIHSVYKVQTRSGGLFAIDLAGAHFGSLKPVWEWEEYMEKRVSIIIDVSPPQDCLGLLDFNTYSRSDIRREIKRAHDLLPLPSADVWREPAGRLSRFLPLINYEILKWQAVSRCAVADLWKLSDEEFEVRAADMVDFVHRGRGLAQRCRTQRGTYLLKRTRGKWVHYKTEADIIP